MRVLLLLAMLFPVLVNADDRQYAIEMRNANIGDVVRMLAHLDGRSIVVPSEGTDQTVTASFQSTTLDDALQAILTANGMGVVVQNNILQVASKETLERLGGDLVVETFPLKYSKAEQVATQVQSLISERGSVMLDERSNTVTVRDTQLKVQDIRTLLSNIDRQDRQVLIEARILEATDDFIRNLGIQWGVTKSTGGVKIGGLESIGTADSDRTLQLDTPSTNPLAGASLALGSFAGTLTDVQLSMAEEQGNVNIISRPSIVTLNNQPAKIHSGVKFFVKTSGDVTIGGSGTGTSASSGSNLQQIDAGITMTVTPQITIDNHVNLKVDVTESKPDFTRAVDGIPSIIDNNAATTVLLRDGETTVIGGLFQLQKTKSKKGIPGLMRIPLFGSLFRSSSKGKNKSELLIFIKPTIVSGNLAKLPEPPEDEAEEPFPEPSKKSRRRNR